LVPVIPGGYPEVIIKKIEEEKKKRKKLDEVVCYLL
jgi:cobyrinic acid a,c-diamide synthase